jgi:hypothetical protein
MLHNDWILVVAEFYLQSPNPLRSSLVGGVAELLPCFGDVKLNRSGEYIDIVAVVRGIQNSKMQVLHC